MSVLLEGNRRLDDRDDSSPETGRRLPASRRSVPARLWSALLSKRTGLVLLLVLGALTLVGTLIVQVPDDIAGNARAEAQWVDSIRPRFGPATDLLLRLGMFDVFGSVWFVVTAALLCASLVASTLQRLPQLWATARHTKVCVSDRSLAHAESRQDLVAEGDPSLLADRASTALRASGYRVQTAVDVESGATFVLAERFRLAPLATVLTHGAIVVIVAGIVLSTSGGFTQADLTMPVGSSAPIGHGTGLTVTATAFSDAYYPSGAPKDFASEVDVSREGQVVASGTVRPNHPLQVEGVTVFQAAFGNAAELTVADATGTVVAHAVVPMRWTSADGALDFGRLVLPGRPLELFVATAASGRPEPVTPPGVVRLDVQRTDTGTAAGSVLLDPGRPREVGGLTYTLVRERQFTGFLVTKDPGRGWVWLGAVLLVLGLVVTIYLRPRRVRVRVAPDGDHALVVIACPERPERWFAPVRDTVAERIGATPSPNGVDP